MSGRDSRQPKTQYHKFQLDGTSSPARRTRNLSSPEETAETRRLGVCYFHRRTKTRCSPNCEYRRLPRNPRSLTSNNGTKTLQTGQGARALAPKPQHPLYFEDRCADIAPMPGGQYFPPVEKRISPPIRGYIADRQPLEKLYVAGDDAPLDTSHSKEVSAVFFAVDAAKLAGPSGLQQVPEKQNIIVNEARARSRGARPVSDNRKADATRIDRSESLPKKRQREKSFKIGLDTQLRTQQKAIEPGTKSSDDNIMVLRQASARRQEVEIASRFMPVDSQSPEPSISKSQLDCEGSTLPRSSLSQFPPHKTIIHNPRAPSTIPEPRWMRVSTSAIPASRKAPTLRYICPVYLEYTSQESSNYEHSLAEKTAGWFGEFRQPQQSQSSTTSSTDMGNTLERRSWAPHTPSYDCNWNNDDDTEVADDPECMSFADSPVGALPDKLMGAETLSRSFKTPMGNLDLPWYTPE